MSSLPNLECLKQENQTINVVFSDARRTILSVTNRFMWSVSRVTKWQFIWSTCSAKLCLHIHWETKTPLQFVKRYIVCQALISDRGGEFTNKCASELCKLLEVTQEFTPAFAHHWLRACERHHRTLAERLTTRTGSERKTIGKWTTLRIIFYEFMCE
jgi:hypothetical protein